MANDDRAVPGVGSGIPCKEVPSTWIVTVEGITIGAHRYYAPNGDNGTWYDVNFAVDGEIRADLFAVRARKAVSFIMAFTDVKEARAMEMVRSATNALLSDEEERKGK
jgi:hypothetical protein